MFWRRRQRERDLEREIRADPLLPAWRAAWVDPLAALRHE
jgi:hypothetical protein